MSAEGFEEAQRRIAEAAATRATVLNLNDLQLTELPDYLWQLTWLEELYVGYSLEKRLEEARGAGYRSVNRLTELSPAIGRLVNLRVLDLRYNRLAALPDSLGQLSALTSLYLYNNQLTALPDSLGQLSALTSLDLRENALTALPDSLGQLSALTSLDLHENALTALPDSLGQLSTLTSLDLSSNQLTALPDNLAQLSNLASLNLYNNKLATLPDSLGQLSALTELNLTNNQFTTLPDSLAQLSTLTELFLSENPLTALPDSLGQLSALTSLYLSDNPLTALPDSLGQLSALISLDLAANRLTTLPNSLGQLSALVSLDLFHNKLITLPDSLRQLTQLEELDLRQNPDLPIPATILEDTENPKAILDAYFAAVAEDKPLYEAKVLVVGQAGVGKSAMVDLLINNQTTNPQIRVPTPSVEQHDWQPGHHDITVNVLKDKEVTLRLWDFGGQDILQATHELFFSTHCMYLVVLDATQNESTNGLLEWLNLIRQYTPDAPIVIVLNKWDAAQPAPLTLQQRTLRDSFGVAEFVPLSCYTGQGREPLAQAILAQVGNIPEIRKVIPRSWVQVRNAVIGEGPYLPYSRFEELCAAQGIAPDVMPSVSAVLDRTGVLLRHEDRASGRITHVLNPNWVTRGVYPLLTLPTGAVRYGIVPASLVRSRLVEGGYHKAQEREFILALITQAEMAYEEKGGAYFIPNLLPVEPTQATEQAWEQGPVVRFLYEYDVIPPKLFPRFVVQVQDEIERETAWRNGVYLVRGGRHYAKVTADTVNNRITLTVQQSGRPGEDGRTLLTSLRHRFRQLHGAYRGRQPREKIPVAGVSSAEKYPNYQDLVDSEANDIPRMIIDGKPHDVVELLNGVTTPQQRADERRQQADPRYDAVVAPSPLQPAYPVPTALPQTLPANEHLLERQQALAERKLVEQREVTERVQRGSAKRIANVIIAGVLFITAGLVLGAWYWYGTAALVNELGILSVVLALGGNVVLWAFRRMVASFIYHQVLTSPDDE